jgi:ubiquinone/menaquinone biosynthesis C-methylase UbiE
MRRKLWLIAVLPLAAVVVGRGIGSDRRKRFVENFRTYSMPSAGVYDAITGWAVRPFYSAVARELVAACSSGTALEVGSGPGRLAVEMAGFAPELQITGLDITPDMVDMANRRAMEAGVAGRVRFEVGDVGAMPFDDSQFDLVVSTFSMHHWPDPARGMAEIQRVLKPGGVGYIYDLSRWVLDGVHESPILPLRAASERVQAGDVERFRGIGPAPIVERLRWRR